MDAMFRKIITWHHCLARGLQNATSSPVHVLVEAKQVVVDYLNQAMKKNHIGKDNQDGNVSVRLLPGKAKLDPWA
eukprot:6271613-Amphidinium_carterae.1